MTDGFCVCPGPGSFARDCGIAAHREVARAVVSDPRSGLDEVRASGPPDRTNDPVDQNSRRKRHDGRQDNGLCPCGIYYKVACRTYCMRTGERHE